MTDPAPVNPPVAPATATDCNVVRAYDWNVHIAYAICMAESGGIPHKNNAGLNRDGSVDYGLMQINSIHADMVGGNLPSLYDPATNMRIAYRLSKGGTDWTPWSTFNSGRYLKYL
jgi:hypothetical protein